MSLKNKKKLEGIVVKTSMQKTMTVLIERKKRHALFKKVIKINKKIKVHDQNEKCKIGDRVEVVSCRPLSKLKRYRLYRVLK